MAYHHGDLRRALLEGAIELLAEGGPSHLTMRGAAQRAGVSSAAPYRHFADKREMLAAVAEEGFFALERACVAATADAEGPVDSFWRRGLAYVKFAIEHPAHYRVMFGPEIPDKRAYDGLHRAAMTAFGALASVLRECSEAGLFAEDEIEKRAMRAWGLVHGLASLYIDGQFNNGGAPTREEFLARVSDVLRLEARVFENAPDGLSRRRDPTV